MSDTRVTVSKKGFIVFMILIIVLAVLLYAHGGAKEIYHNCTQAKAAGKGNIKIGDPLYDRSLDRDNDGLACEL